MHADHASVGKPVAVITGGGTGIGAAIAQRFAEDGFNVAVLGRRIEPITEVATAINGFAVVADAADSASASEAVRLVLEKYGRIDVFVANAGGHGFSPVGETTDEDWHSSLQVNLDTAFVMARECLPALLESKGQIVIISSLAGIGAGPSTAGYTVGKHALIGLTRSLARDYGTHGIRVNAVCPGWVKTPMADAEMDEFAEHASGIAGRDQAYAKVTENVPLRRAAEPHEIASIVRFLGSEQSSYMTGAVLVADGGAHIVDLPTIAFEQAGM